MGMLLNESGKNSHVDSFSLFLIIDKVDTDIHFAFCFRLLFLCEWVSIHSRELKLGALNFALFCCLNTSASKVTLKS